MTSDIKHQSGYVAPNPSNIKESMNSPMSPEGYEINEEQ